ncbi:hypothetical protein ACFQY0_09975 [Haloferula chungangensis]|uniref:Uncharacterized protein n=1 Tax=Haloferula chungangensis TaxID=1048331 RepID=A0ABW2L568_9BACT
MRSRSLRHPSSASRDSNRRFIRPEKLAGSADPARRSAVQCGTVKLMADLPGDPPFGKFSPFRP